MTTKNNITCKLTGTVGPGIKSHIIPKSLLGPHNPNTVVVGDKMHYKRIRNGLYDPGIVTAEGEKILEKLDDYASKLLINGEYTVHHYPEETIEKLKQRGKPVISTEAARIYNDYDYTTLKLFCLSVLWRMSISTRNELNGVELGPHQDTIREMILNHDARDPETYSVNMFYFVEEYTEGMVLFPVKEKFDGVNVYRLHMGRYMALVKIDKRPTLPEHRKIILNPSTPLALCARQYTTGPEADLFHTSFAKGSWKVPHLFHKED